MTPNSIDPEIRMLALVPPDRTAATVSAYKILVEELAKLAGTGIEIHAISEHVSQTTTVPSATLHPIPRVRNVWHTLRTLPSLLRGKTQAGGTQHDVNYRLKRGRFERTMDKVIREHRINLVYSPFAWPQSTAGIDTAHRRGVPVVVSLRGADVFSVPEINYGRAPQQTPIATTLKRADHVIGVSRALADKAIELGADPQHVSVVCKGVDLEHFSPGDKTESRRKLGIPDSPTVLFVGSFVPVKGINVLLSAFDRVVGKIPQAQLVMCGDGPELASVQKHRDEQSNSQRIILPGRIPRDQIADYFRAADLFVLPSLSEGSGNVLLEAAACEVPTVGSAVGGIPDYIEDGTTGWLFEKQNDQDLADKLLQLLEDPAMATQMGQAGRGRVVSTFQYSHMIDAILATFTRVLQESTHQSTVAQATETSGAVTSLSL